MVESLLFYDFKDGLLAAIFRRYYDYYTAPSVSHAPTADSLGTAFIMSIVIVHRH